VKRAHVGGEPRGDADVIDGGAVEWHRCNSSDEFCRRARESRLG
jgi:hypothetical protein